MKKKMKLDDLSLSSFVTEQKALVGGASCACSVPTTGPCRYLCSENQWCTLH